MHLKFFNKGEIDCGRLMGTWSAGTCRSGAWWVVAPALLSLALVFFLPAPSLLFADQPVADIEIFVPENLTSISSENIQVAGEQRRSISVLSTTTGKKVALVGRVESSTLPEMEIANNGRSQDAPVFHKNYFHAQVILAYGINMIEVRWRAHGAHDWSTKSISIFRSSKLEGGVNSNYPPYTFHKGDNEERCQECHQMQLTKEERETGMERGCLKCHGALVANSHVHGPVSVGICTVCHDPKSAPNKYRVQEDDKYLCYQCHEDRKKIDEGKKLQHGPVGAGMCTVCHDPHSSPFELQLVKPRNEICAMCHQEDADRWLGKPSLHPPFASGNCPGCHDPHSSDYKYNLKADRKDICALCHQLPIPGHLHEAGGKPRFELPEDFPLTEDGKIMCLTCHDPHGAVGPKMTRRKGCDGCHP